MKRKIITLSRQFCSGGDEIAAKLARLLDVPLIGREQVKEKMREQGIEPDAFERLDERTGNSFLYSLAMASINGQLPNGVNEVLMGDRFFEAQSKILFATAAESDAVFVGRCADFVLSEKYETVKVFIHAPFEYRAKKAEKEFNLKPSHAETLVKKSDKKRSSYYSFYAGEVWGEASNYDITINSQSLGIECSAKLLKDFCNYAFPTKE